MTSLDIFVVTAYLFALVLTGFIVSRRISNANDLFSAGGQSPWWLAGVSAYMTMFSSGTFVAWGGVAYQAGFVAVSICMTHGVAALLIGYFVAAKWRATGVSSAGEFVYVRYGSKALYMFTWLNLITRTLGVGVAIYSIAVLVSALISLPSGHPLADPVTGTLAVNWTILMVGFVVVGYTIAGGLWAVLMTDVIQFVVLTSSVIIIVPLLVMQLGGIESAFAALPESHLAFVTNDYTLSFLFGFLVLHALKIGGEWAFVQRSLCVRSPRDAKKAHLFFGIAYLTTPLFWMLPPLLYAGMNSGANPEQAYILAAREVLPAGLLGLMIVSMFSATASMADSEINVFSGALTLEIYKRRQGGDVSSRRLVAIGRMFTTGLGATMVMVALSVPFFGGAADLTITTVNLLVGPLAMPVVWSLFSKYIQARSLWTIVGSSFCASVALKVLLPNLTADGPGLLVAVAHWAGENPNLSEQIPGLLLPFVLLLWFEVRGRKENKIDEGWTRVRAFEAEHGMAEDAIIEAGSTDENYQNGLLLGLFMAGLAALFIVIGILVTEGRFLMLVFAAMMFTVAIPLIVGGERCRAFWRFLTAR